jgi:SOUL heme-binding protein
VEQPKHALVTQDGAIELRDYPAIVVAEVTRRGDRNSAVRAGFGPLAGYIFAKNRGGESVSMTAPVTQTPTGSAHQTWLIRFVMPAKYTLETLPKAGNDDVRLLQVPPARRAAIRFSGVATDGLVATNETILREWLAARRITILGAPTFAYYNDPFTLGPLRRNEVMFDVEKPWGRSWRAWQWSASCQTDEHGNYSGQLHHVEHDGQAVELVEPALGSRVAGSVDGRHQYLAGDDGNERSRRHEAGRQRIARP